MFKRLYRSPRFRGALRAAGFLASVNLAITALVLPRASAHAEESVKQSGLALLQQLGPALIERPEVVTLNGQRMSLSSKSTTLGLNEVMQRFERYCQEGSGALDRELEALPTTRALLQTLPPEFADPSRWFTHKQLADDGQAGQIACLTRRVSGGEAPGLLERVLAFTETGDVSALGDARYVVARRDEKSGTTHVLAMWTEGKFDIPAMFADEGDSPGSDSRHVPRPPESKRVLTAEISGHPYAVRMYDSAKSPSEVLVHYEEQLSARGFGLSELPTDSESELNLNEHVRAFSRDGVAVIVVTGETPAGKTGVTLIEMGSRGFANAAVAVGGSRE